MENRSLNRKQLYDLIWSTPRTAICTKYGIKDHQLVKLCQDLNIPLPAAGHWEKLRAGKNPEIRPFPEQSTSDDVIDINGYFSMPLSFREKVSIRQKLIEAQNDSLLKVPATLKHAEAIIIQTRDNIQSRYSSYSRYGDQKRSGSGFIDITATESLLPRALRFMDALIKLLHARGHSVQAQSDTTNAILCKEKMQIKCREKSKMTYKEDKDSWGGRSATYNNTGLLTFKIRFWWSTEKEWTDGRVLLDAQLSNIVAWMEIKAEEEAEESRLRELEREKEKEIERQQQALLKRQEDELDAFKRLHNAAKRWNASMFIREYINHREEDIRKRGEVSDELSKWLNWARKKADWYDPCIEAPDELLKNFNRDEVNLE